MRILTSGVMALMLVIVCGTASQILLKIGILQAGPAQVSIIELLRKAGHLYIFLALILMAFGFFSWMFAVSRLSLHFATMMLQVVPVLVVFSSKFIFGEEIPVIRWVGFVIIIFGLALVMMADGLPNNLTKV